VVLPDGSPLTLAQVWSPEFPILPPFAGGLETLIFGIFIWHRSPNSCIDERSVVFGTFLAFATRYLAPGRTPMLVLDLARSGTAEAVLIESWYRRPAAAMIASRSSSRLAFLRI